MNIKQVRVHSPRSIANLVPSFYVFRIVIGNFMDIQTALGLWFEEQALVAYGTIVSKEAVNPGDCDYL